MNLSFICDDVRRPELLYSIYADDKFVFIFLQSFPAMSRQDAEVLQGVCFRRLKSQQIKCFLVFSVACLWFSLQIHVYEAFHQGPHS